MSKGQVDGGGNDDGSGCSIGHFIVAAIDFGTTFSGYAFSFKHDFDKDPTQVSKCTITPDRQERQQMKTLILLRNVD